MQITKQQILSLKSSNPQMPFLTTISSNAAIFSQTKDHLEKSITGLKAKIRQRRESDLDLQAIMLRQKQLARFENEKIIKMKIEAEADQKYRTYIESKLAEERARFRIESEKRNAQKQNCEAMYQFLSERRAKQLEILNRSLIYAEMSREVPSNMVVQTLADTANHYADHSIDAKKPVVYFYDEKKSHSKRRKYEFDSIDNDQELVCKYQNGSRLRDYIVDLDNYQASLLNSKHSDDFPASHSHSHSQKTRLSRSRTSAIAAKDQTNIETKQFTRSPLKASNQVKTNTRSAINQFSPLSSNANKSRSKRKASLQLSRLYKPTKSKTKKLHRTISVRSLKKVEKVYRDRNSWVIDQLKWGKTRDKRNYKNCRKKRGNIIANKMLIFSKDGTLLTNSYKQGSKAHQNFKLSTSAKQSQVNSKLYCVNEQNSNTRSPIAGLDKSEYSKNCQSRSPHLQHGSPSRSQAIQSQALKKIKKRLKLSKVVYRDSKFPNIKHELQHLNGTYELEIQLRKDMRDRINVHPSILKKYDMVVC